MKEMVGGCCVCSDERGWTENPLVYCDGQGCTVAVHQACYGIVTVPSGPWYCRKCESQETAARVRCELCPSRDGALKKTDSNAWAHVVCALYIPEVRFGNVTTMEPIILQLIPQERYSKSCYICEEEGKGTRSSIGACMQCNKSGCKQQFHVTCAQSLGLLCEEAGNYMDNVKYCGYCQHHYSKLKKGGNVKTIPPYKPVHTDTVLTDSSPDKEVTDSTAKPGPIKRKNSTKSAPVSTVAPSKTTKIVGEATGDSKELGGAKFTTSNFVESVVTNSESVFGAETIPGGRTVAPLSTKKRKSGNRTPPLASDEPLPASIAELGMSRVKTENVSNELDPPVIKVELGEKSLPSTPVEEKPTPISKGTNVIASTIKSNVITSTGSVTSSIVVSVPISAATALQQNASVLSTPPTLFQQLQLSIVAANNAAGMSSSPSSSVPALPEAQPAKRRRSQSSEKSDKSRKNKRATPPTSVPSPCIAANKRNSRSQMDTPPPAPVRASPLTLPVTSTAVHIKDSPPSSPASEEAYSAAQHRKNKKKNARDRVEPKDTSKMFSNGVSAPHMLGNQLNPSSNMSKKLSDALSNELEAHSVFTESNTASQLVGPQLHSRVIASVRSGAAAAAAASNSSGNSLSMGLSAAFGGGNLSGTIPQSLDQLLERQWEQGSQFLMEQAQHFDIASLLSCLHQLRAENLRLEEHVNNLLQRRDHLLAVNARLAIPLTTQPPTQVNNVHPEPPVRNQRMNNTYPHGVENGLDGGGGGLYPSPHRSPSGVPVQQQAAPGRGSLPDNRRMSNQQQPSYPTYQVGSTPSNQSQLSAATTQAIHAPRRDAVTDLHAMSSGKHS